MSQIQEMIKPAAAMLDIYPVVTTKQKTKQWIKTCVPGMTPEKVERYSWPQALLAMGLLQAYEQTKDKTALSSVFSYLRRWIFLAATGTGGTPGYLSRGHDRIWGLAGSRDCSCAAFRTVEPCTEPSGSHHADEHP